MKHRNYKSPYNSKSRAALEFLTTYGWAFLVILIMVSTLAYFGILSPSKLLPDRCNFGAEISCDKNRMVVSAVAENTLQMQLTNNFGSAVVVTTGRITTDVSAAGTCEAQIENDNAISNYAWGAGEVIVLYADCTGGASLTLKEKIKFGIELDYYAATAGSAYTKTIFGEALTSAK